MIRHIIKSFVIIFILFSYNSFAQTTEAQFTFIGDAGKDNKNTTKLLNSLIRNNRYELINSGDNLYQSVYGDLTYEGVWKKWFDAGFSFFASAIGNHNESYEKEISFFSMPAEYYSKSTENLVRFIVLNSDNDSKFDFQAQFLEKMLIDATEPFVFILYHHPSYALSVLHNPAVEKTNFQKAIRPILFKYQNKITGILNGHDHVALLAQFNNLPVFLNGAGQDLRKHIPLNYNDDQVKVSTLWFDNTAPYWVNLNVNAQTQYATIQYVRSVDDKITCSVRVKTGQNVEIIDGCKN